VSVMKSNRAIEDYFSNDLNRNGSSEIDYFRLDKKFLEKFEDKKPKFGYNGLGELVFYRTYSRLKLDGTKETALDTFARVVEGCYEIQRRYCRKMHISWTFSKAQRSAKEMFQRMWDFKFLPPGRGLWAMGTDFMWDRGSAALQNCAFVSTQDIDNIMSEPFCFTMDMSMVGVGVVLTRCRCEGHYLRRMCLWCQTHVRGGWKLWLS
jgi:ribonucleoside-triphosphate reductase (thioredoxin)